MILSIDNGRSGLGILHVLQDIFEVLGGHIGIGAYEYTVAETIIFITFAVGLLAYIWIKNIDNIKNRIYPIKRTVLLLLCILVYSIYMGVSLHNYYDWIYDWQFNTFTVFRIIYILPIFILIIYESKKIGKDLDFVLIASFGIAVYLVNVAIIIEYFFDPDDYMNIRIIPIVINILYALVLLVKVIIGLIKQEKGRYMALYDMGQPAFSYCGKCGNRVKSDKNFCTKCGNPVIKKGRKNVLR